MGETGLNPSSALSPKTWPFRLEWLPQPAYLVGGAVRDALLGRQAEYLDLDFVLPTGSVEAADAIARRCGAGFVVLDAERQIARVVFERATADFALQEGNSLENDLQRRDFTVNAVAYDPHHNQLIDPLQGHPDLQQGQIRMVSARNLKDDPLRLLRAYRQAAQLGFNLDAETQATICQLAGSIAQIAAERVQTELSYLLSTAIGSQWLQTVWQDGLLAPWLPDTTPAGVELVLWLDQVAQRSQQIWPDFAATLWHRLRQRAPGGARHRVTAAKLACLLPPDLEQANTQLNRLKYSRAEIQAVLPVCQYLSRGQSVDSLSAMSLREQYFFFRATGTAFPSVAIAAIALAITTKNQTGHPDSTAPANTIDALLNRIAPLIHRFLNASDPVAHPIPPIAGRELMAALHLAPGPRIGQLLEAIQLARAEGKITTPDEALDFAASLHSKDL